MNIKKVICTVLPLFAVWPVAAMTISGVVKNSDGVVMEGVAVKLGKADILTFTGADGSFTLTDGTGLRQAHHVASYGDCPFFLEGDRLLFTGKEQAQVKVTVYDCNGKLLVSQAKDIAEGSRTFSLPHFGSGMHLYRVVVNNMPYTFKSVTGIVPNRSPASSSKEIGLAKQVAATVPLDDALLFIKEGYRLSRIVVTKPDTTGLEVTMNALDTGTVTDAEGNVYRTVKIGNQEWMAENLRSTKFKDGSSIGNNCLFYKNTTDAAAKKKWGALYTQSAAKSNKLGINGWHLPTNADWDTLLNYLITHGYNYDGTTSENKIAKSLASVADWEETIDPGGIGCDPRLNNASGFSALPAGWRYWQGNEFKEQGSHTYWWSATQHDGTYTCVSALWSINFNLDMSWWTLVACSVRLVRDN